MKVFLSSLIAGFGPFRDAARRAITTLRNEAVMAEDFAAQPNSPQVACLQGLRSADVVVLVLGEAYGVPQPGSGLSATHEEYREARHTKSVLAFVQQGVTPEPAQEDFIAEVQTWEGGLFRVGFTDAEDLNSGIIRALHDFAMTNAVGAADPEDLARRAKALIPSENRQTVTTATVDVAIAMGPQQRLLRPAEIEAPDLARSLLQAALFGPDQLFDETLGSDTVLANGALVLRQERGALFRIDENGSILIRLPLDEARRGTRPDMGGMMVLVEEVVQQKLGVALGYAGSVIERIDPTQRITDIGVASNIGGAEYRAWRTQTQHARNPNSVSIGMVQGERQPVVSVHRRAALRVDRARMVEDLLVPLRRGFSQG